MSWPLCRSLAASSKRKRTSTMWQNHIAFQTILLSFSNEQAFFQCYKHSFVVACRWGAEGDPGVIVPTRVATGVHTWAHNHHMLSMARQVKETTALFVKEKINRLSSEFTHDMLQLRSQRWCPRLCKHLPRRYGVRASASGSHCSLRSFGFQEINECKAE